MKLDQYILQSFGGNKSKFARSIGVFRQQVDAWLNLDCIWHHGNIWQNKTKFVKTASLSKLSVAELASATAIELCGEFVSLEFLITFLKDGGADINKYEFSIAPISGILEIKNV